MLTKLGAITERTKAIIPVHLFGQCAEIDRICQMACEHDLPVIKMLPRPLAATTPDRRKLGADWLFQFLSNQEPGGMGDGGMMTSCDASTADRLRRLQDMECVHATIIKLLGSTVVWTHFRLRY